MLLCHEMVKFDPKYVKILLFEIDNKKVSSRGVNHYVLGITYLFYYAQTTMIK
jgi:hypothetical protein